MTDISIAETVNNTTSAESTSFVSVNEQVILVENCDTNVTVNVLEAPVTVAVTEEHNVVNVEESTVNVHVGYTNVFVASGSSGMANRERVLATAFSGGDGTTDRVYTFSVGLGTKQIVAVGTASGTLTILDSTGGYTLSTTTETNDTLTIHLPLFNSDAVIVWY